MGFLEAVVEVHRRNQIPAGLFCTGAAIEAREEEFRDFWKEVKDDPLFDIEDHSYSHIGLGYERGKSVDALRADYERSFAVHERVFGVRPIGVSLCGTGGKDGEPLPGFDANDKSKAELEMMAQLGVRMITTFLSTADRASEFTNYSSLGHPEIMGFPTANGDLHWMCRRVSAEEGYWALDSGWRNKAGNIFDTICANAEAGRHMPLTLHDWAAWNVAGDRNLDFLVEIVGRARECGYELATHKDCYRDRTTWTGDQAAHVS